MTVKEGKKVFVVEGVRRWGNGGLCPVGIFSLTRRRLHLLVLLQDRTKSYRAYSIKKELYEFRPLVFSLNTQWGQVRSV